MGACDRKFNNDRETEQELWTLQAVKDLNLQVHYKEIFGFLGPNGAGKTTTIRVLTTLTKPTSGYASIGGYDVVKETAKVKRMIGVVQQHLTLDRDLTVRENMEFHARLHRLGASERKKRIAELLEYVELQEYADKMVDTLSAGMKKRAAIVCSLLDEPEALFLDEPTKGWMLRLGVVCGIWFAVSTRRAPRSS